MTIPSSQLNPEPHTLNSLSGPGFDTSRDQFGKLVDQVRAIRYADAEANCCRRT
jgi:hypothetical protein